VRERYTPERLKQWLDRSGHAGSYAGIFVIPTRSPFQW
jgi:hypothetical protein